MTNAEKYLKDEMQLKDFISDYIEYCKRNKQDSVNLESLSLFLITETKPIILKDKIREYAKSIVDDDLYKMNCRYDVNGTEIRKDLEELIKDD